MSLGQFRSQKSIWNWLFAKAQSVLSWSVCVLQPRKSSVLLERKWGALLVKKRSEYTVTHANSHCMVILANQYMEFATRSSTAIKIYPINLIHWLLSSRTLMCHGRTVLSCTLNDPSFAELIYDHISTLLGNVGVTQKCRPYTQILIKSHIHP